MLTLDSLRASHPRLLLTPERMFALHSRLETDSLLRAFVQVLQQQSDVLAAEPPVPFRTIPFAEFGIQMLEVSRAILGRITLHGLFYRLTGERRYADRVWREVETALAYPTWNPAHFLDAAEMLLAMAWAYDWLFDAWTSDQRAQLRDAMMKRAMARGLEIYETRQGLSAFFVTSTANWSSVCNAGLLAAALAIADDEPDLAQRIVTHAITSLANPRRGYEPDGASEEGATYWNYGTEFFCVAAGVLESALGHDADLLASRAFSHTALYRLHVQSPTGQNFQYADSWPHSRASFAYAYVANRFGPEPARAHVRELLPGLLAPMPPGESTYRLAPLVALWLPEKPTPRVAEQVELDAFFSGRAQLAMMRSAWGDPKAAYLAFKAGHAIHNHSHLDLGSFVFDAGGVRWSADLGPDSYSLPGYFRSERNGSNPLNEETKHLPHRWSYFRNNNHGHSTLTLGGQLQSRDAVAPFIDHASTPARAYAIADLSQAYPGQASRWLRGAALVDRTWVAIRDELSGLEPGVSVEWKMITEAAVDIGADGRSARLTRDGEEWELCVVTAPTNIRITAVPALPLTPAENQNVGFTRLVIFWNAQSTEAVFELHLVPAQAQKPRIEVGPLHEWSR